MAPSDAQLLPQTSAGFQCGAVYANIQNIFVHAAAQQLLRELDSIVLLVWREGGQAVEEPDTETP